MTGERERESSTLTIAPNHPQQRAHILLRKWDAPFKAMALQGRGAHLESQHVGACEFEASLISLVSPIPEEMNQQQHTHPTAAGSAGRQTLPRMNTVQGGGAQDRSASRHSSHSAYNACSETLASVRSAASSMLVCFVQCTLSPNF